MCKICNVHFFFVLNQENTFLVKSGQQNQNCQLKQKFGTRTNLNMRNSMIIFTFSVFGHKYLSLANLVWKFKIVCSK